MKKMKVLAATLAMVMVAAFTGCGSTDSGSESADGPYIGYAPMTQETMEMVNVASESGNNGMSDIQLLQYDAGDNNEAVFRLEKSTKDGRWETIKEQKLILQNNLKSGFMAVGGSSWDGYRINTDMLEFKYTLVPNIITFDKPKDGDDYGTHSFFGDNEVADMSEEELLAKTDNMDMGSKKALMVSFEDSVPLVKDGKPCDDYDAEGTVEADVSAIYANEDGIWTDVYKEQKMLALTVEFAFDEMLEKAPCLYSDETGVTKYVAGPYRMAELCLKKSTPEGKWKNVGDSDYISIPAENSTGELTISEESGNAVVISAPNYETDNGKQARTSADFDVPGHEGSLVVEYSGINNGEPVKATKALPVYMAFDKQAGKAIDGISAMDFFKNKDGQYSDIYKDNTFYVITMKFVE